MVYIAVLLLVLVIVWFVLKTPKKSVKKVSRQQTKPIPPAAQNNSFVFDFTQGKGVERVLQPSPSADKEVLVEYVKCLDEIPSLPTVWPELLAAIERGDAANKVAYYIKSEPTLAAEVLRHANMLAAKDVNDLGQAVVLLGYNAVRGIVTKFCMGSLKVKSNTTYKSSVLWKHAIATSALASITAKYIPGCNAGIAGTLGLLHDLGRIGINVALPKKLVSLSNAEHGYLQIEQGTFGVNHLQAGELLAKHWHLSDLIQTGIAFHHHPAFAEPEKIPDNIRKEVLAVYLADMLAIHFGFSGGHSFLSLPLKAYATLMNASLEDIANDPMVSKELWRVKAINF